MSSIDSDLFAPIDGSAAGSPQTDEMDQIEQLYQLLFSMHDDEEMILNFDTHNIRFQLRLIGRLT